MDKLTQEIADIKADIKKLQWQYDDMDDKDERRSIKKIINMCKKELTQKELKLIFNTKEND